MAVGLKAPIWCRKLLIDPYIHLVPSTRRRFKSKKLGQVDARISSADRFRIARGSLTPASSDKCSLFAPFG